MTATHIMLDLETWGTEPGCDIRSIGACLFDPATGAVNDRDGEPHPSHFYLACDNPIVWGEKYPLTRDPRTVQWWNDQSPEAQSAFANPIDLRDALARFSQWLTPIDLADVNNSNGGIRLWSHGPAFDVAILAAAYKAVGLPLPWHYRAPRDTRTAFDMAGILDHSGWMEKHSTGTFHHALDDAISQAKAVCSAFERLRMRTPSAWRKGHD